MKIAHFEDSLTLGSIMISEQIKLISHDMLRQKLPFAPSILRVLATSESDGAVVGSYVTHEAKHFIYFYIGDGSNECSCFDAAALTREVL